MDFVDTHCHIQSAGNPVGERTTSDLWRKWPNLTGDVLIANAHAADVQSLICVGCDLADSQLAEHFASSRTNVWASAGIHPHEASSMINNSPGWTAFERLLGTKKVIAIGECGLDYYYEHSPAADQKTVLRRQLALAAEHELPLIFHVREAFDDFWPILDEFPHIRGVLHSYTDTAINLSIAIDRGLFIGVNGIATFAKHAAQLEMYAAIPLENLVLETDAPFLTPTPYRGNVNEPKHIVTVASFLSQLKDIAIKDIATATTTNANTLFGLK